MEAAVSVMATLLSGDMYQHAKLDEVSQKRCLVVGASGGLGGTDVEYGRRKVLQRGGKFITAVGPCKAIDDC
eukprot:8979469-Ditylum_brightwellii.AAC.1